MYREQSEQSEPTRDDPGLVTAAHLGAMVKQAAAGLEQKSDAMFGFAAASAVLAILSAIVCGPALVLSAAWWVRILSGIALVGTVSNVAYFLLGYSKRRALAQELGARLVDVEQCAEARQDHYIRRALATVRKANSHLGVES